MNKTVLTTLASILLLGSAGTAQAGERGHDRGPGHRGSYGYVSHYRGPALSHHRGRHFAGYRGHAPRYYPYYSSHHHVSDGLKVVAGALVLGSIIHAVNDSRREPAVYRTRVPANRGDYWYRIDSDGQCVEVRLNGQGQEVWTYTDSSYCY